MARNSKAAKAAAADKPLSIPQLIERLNDANARMKDAKRDVEACKAPLKAWAEKVGSKTSPTEIRAEGNIDGHTCIVYLGLATGFAPDPVKVIKRFGLDTCLAAELLKVALDPLRDLATKNQVPMTDLGEAKEPVVSLGKCEAVKIKR